MLVDAASRTTIGGTGVEITRMSLGCGPFGDMWAPVPDDQAIATVQAAFGHGIRYFDTAPLYGVGRSERRLGLGLAGLPRDQVTVSTKVGRVLQDDDGTVPPTFEYTPDAVKRSLEGSHDRLKLDRFDIVHVHDPERHVEAAMEGAFPTLRALQAAGEIGAVSLPHWTRTLALAVRLFQAVPEVPLRGEVDRAGVANSADVSRFLGDGFQGSGGC